MIWKFTGPKHIHSRRIKLEGKQRGVGIHELVSFLQISERTRIKIRIGIVQIIFIVLGIVIVVDNEHHRSAIAKTRRWVGNAGERTTGGRNSEQATASSRGTRRRWRC